jgi:hypothetical protein
MCIIHNKGTEPTDKYTAAPKIISTDLLILYYKRKWHRVTKWSWKRVSIKKSTGEE